VLSCDDFATSQLPKTPCRKRYCGLNAMARDGMPANPRGWLIQVALRRMTDHLRSEISRRTRESVLAAETPIAVAPDIYSEPGIDPDDTLILLFMCCHPALTPSSAIALTLRAVGGLTTAEIANAYMVPEATMAQRISRAKQTVRDLECPFDMPADKTPILGSVLHVLYLIFNEGYTSSVGADPATTGSRERSDPAHSRSARTTSREQRSGGTARAHVAHRRPTARTSRRER